MSDDGWRFDGFLNPTTTPVPDVLFDELLHRLGEAELRALLYIVRRTFGFKKDADDISFNQFMNGIVTRDGRQLDRGCGIRNRTTLSNALRSLEAKGIIETKKGKDERGENVTTTYGLRFQGVVQQPYYRSTASGPEVVRLPYPQQTDQQTDMVEAPISIDDRIRAAANPKAVPARPPRS